ncbi:MAG: hypothetical protein ACK4SY_09975 [Pyrobaculum sp.]
MSTGTVRRRPYRSGDRRGSIDVLIKELRGEPWAIIKKGGGPILPERPRESKIVTPHTELMPPPRPYGGVKLLSPAGSSEPEGVVKEGHRKTHIGVKPEGPKPKPGDPLWQRIQEQRERQKREWEELAKKGINPLAYFRKRHEEWLQRELPEIWQKMQKQKEVEKEIKKRLLEELKGREEVKQQKVIQQEITPKPQEVKQEPRREVKSHEVKQSEKQIDLINLKPTCIGGPRRGGCVPHEDVIREDRVKEGMEIQPIKRGTMEGRNVMNDVLTRAEERVERLVEMERRAMERFEEKKHEFKPREVDGIKRWTPEEVKREFEKRVEAVTPKIDVVVKPVDEFKPRDRPREFELKPRESEFKPKEVAKWREVVMV